MPTSSDCDPSCNTAATRALPKKQPESTPAHSAAEDALALRHHLIIHHGAGPIQFVYPSGSPLAAAEMILKQNAIFTIFVFFLVYAPSSHRVSIHHPTPIFLNK